MAYFVDKIPFLCVIMESLYNRGIIRKVIQPRFKYTR